VSGQKQPFYLPNYTFVQYTRQKQMHLPMGSGLSGGLNIYEEETS
jgi:hypothetical protein